MWVSLVRIHGCGGVMFLDFWGVVRRIKVYYFGKKFCSLRKFIGSFMEANVSGDSHKLYGSGTSNGVGKKSVEWDLNEWKWDGHQFLASPLNASPSDCKNKQLVAVPASNSSSACSEEIAVSVVGKGKGELEKRKRILHVGEDGGLCEEEDGALNLELGGQSYTIAEREMRNGGKRGSCSHSVCQVDGCGADLTDVKDYHRRHKVCEMHAKACSAMVGSFMQRFCQQCSRFHLLQEFDEGKRSCRRRLAGHNKRRRKTHPDTTVGGSSLTTDQASSYLLISLLKVLTNLHSDRSDKLKDQDVLSHLLGNIASIVGSSDSGNLSGFLQPSQGPHPRASVETPTEAEIAVPSNDLAAKGSSWPACPPSKACLTDAQGSLRAIDHSVVMPVTTMDISSRQNIGLGENVQAISCQRYPTLLTTEGVSCPKGEAVCSLQCMLPSDSMVDRVRLKDFDLNCTYTDTQDCGRVSEQPSTGAILGNGSPNFPLWMLQGSHHVTLQSRTDRIVFKLFGKDPSDFPLKLRAQILDWLSHSPTDMESYIRPGCIVLTVYLRLADSVWEEMNNDLCYSLDKLFCNAGDDFWRMGWVFASIQHHVAFIYNGHIVLDSPLVVESPNYCKITSVTPIAVSISARVNFTVKGHNLAHSTASLLCAFEGRYLITETTQLLVDRHNVGTKHDEYQSLSFSCSIPNATGRGYIEVEDNGLSCSFFPFIVAEEDVCSEIRMLENLISVSTCDDILQEKPDATSGRLAMNFLNEIGWLLQRSHLKTRSEEVISGQGLFSLKRFRWLMRFAMEQEWCAVVKKLLNILFEGIVDLGGLTPSELALSEELLHLAVRKNCKSMVELLLRYRPDAASEETGSRNFLFRPDMIGPSNLTPLHIAASISGAEGVLDALLDDPGQFGLKAWKYARDCTGVTPEDYALSKGHHSYIRLVQGKLTAVRMKVTYINVPGGVFSSDASHRQLDRPNASKVTSFDIEKSGLSTRQPLCTL
ncbi:squamosa promoter-binding-like protein 12 [Iris pallida]|uniref:Squamosa promoter-binding-like protein 12 n=1 Tax=Iris pallida TaxID=29817 RepID=A0AAX6FSF5_IRIPA|nr:squamosa promoter-binding-like protein 12 [Iris pallida]